MKLFLSFIVAAFAEENWHPDCTSLEQAAICHDACLADFGKCIEIECENDITNASCLRDCSDAADACDLKCPCQINGECELGCPCPSFQCAPSCDEAEDIERSQECIEWCFSAANETYNDCLYPEFTTGAVLPTALPNTTFPDPATFAAKSESFDLLPEDLELCEKLAKEWSVECQMGCPCNQNCPTCSQLEDTCNVEFCPAISTSTTTTTTSTTPSSDSDGSGGSASTALLNVMLIIFAFILVK